MKYIHGKNRVRSMKNGFVVPLCRKCHEDYTIQNWLKRFCQITYEENHSRDEFIEIIGRSYFKD